MSKVAEACRALKRLPTHGELRLYGKQAEEFPSHSTIASHFHDRNGLLNALQDWALRTSSADIAALLPTTIPQKAYSAPSRTEDGWVYLIKSGAHFKIGRSAQIERRIKEIKIAMPETSNMIHAIATDDPAGIEAYWHRRFADKRANGEWFRLTSAEVSAFKRRKFQ